MSLMVATFLVPEAALGGLVLEKDLSYTVKDSGFAAMLTGVGLQC